MVKSRTVPDTGSAVEPADRVKVGANFCTFVLEGTAQVMAVPVMSAGMSGRPKDSNPAHAKRTLLRP